MTTDTSPLIFLMGVTGQTGRYILEDFDQNPGDARIRIGVRKQEDLERLRPPIIGGTPNGWNSSRVRRCCR